MILAKYAQGKCATGDPVKVHQIPSKVHYISQEVDRVQLMRVCIQLCQKVFFVFNFVWQLGGVGMCEGGV